MLHTWLCVLPSDVRRVGPLNLGGSLTVADLSDLIRHRRAARDLTQLELAMLAGFDVDTIAEFEAGRNLDRYARFFWRRGRGVSRGLCWVTSPRRARCRWRPAFLLFSRAAGCSRRVTFGEAN